MVPLGPKVTWIGMWAGRPSPGSRIRLCTIHTYVRLSSPRAQPVHIGARHRGFVLSHTTVRYDTSPTCKLLLEATRHIYMSDMYLLCMPLPWAGFRLAVPPPPTHTHTLH